MADDTTDLENKRPTGPLWFQSDADLEKNTGGGVTRTGTQIDSDGDGVPDARDEAPNEYGTDADGDNDDADGDGVDDDDEYDYEAEDDEDWYADFDNDRHHFFGCDNALCKIDDPNSPYYKYYQNASTADKTALNTAKQTQAQLTQAPVTANNFIALKKSEVNVNIASATIVQNGGGPDQTNRIRGLKSANTRLDNLEASLQGKTEAEKIAILKEKFPKQFERYEEGKPLQSHSRTGASYSSAQNDPPGGTLPGAPVEQPFAQRLYQLFASAVSPPATITPAPTAAPTTPTVQNQTLTA